MMIFALVLLGTLVAAMLAGAVALSRQTRAQPGRARRPRSRRARWLPIAAAVVLAAAGSAALMALLGREALPILGVLAVCALYGGLITWAATSGPKRGGGEDDDHSDDGGSGWDDGPSPTIPGGGLRIDWERFERDAFRAYQVHRHLEPAAAPA